MERIFIPLYRFLRKNKALMYFLMIASSLVFIYFGSKIVFIEDITKLLPQEGPASKSTLVFDDLKVKDMIILQVAAEDKKGSEVAQLTDDFVAHVMAADSTTSYISHIISGIDPQGVVENNYDKIEAGKEFVKSHIPTFFNESQINSFDALLTSEALDSIMRAKNEALAEYENNGDFDKYISTLNMMSEDPAGLLNTLIPSTGAEAVGGIKFIDGHLMSSDSTVALSFISTAFNSLESAKCTDLVRMLEKEARRFERNNPGSQVLFHGLPVNAASNSRQIKADVVVTIGISLILICIIFGFVFRNKSTLPLLLSPIAWGAMFALSCLYWIQGTISLLAMGLGAVLLGVALSYCLHIITHYKYVSNPEKVLKDQSSPVILGCITTVGAFVALLFTNSSLLRDFGIFATLSILGTVFFSLVFTPQFLKPERNKVAKRVFRALDKINDYPFDKLVIFRWVLVAVCVVCIWASSMVGFDCNLRNIGYQSEASLRSRDVYSEKFNEGNLSLYFAAFADTRDQALEYTSKLTQSLDLMKQEGKVNRYMDVSQVFVPEKEQQKRLDAWSAYWTPERIESAKSSIEAAAEKHLGENYYQGMFDPFYESISKNDYETGSLYDQDLIPEEIIANFIDEASGKYLVMTSAVMPHDCMEDVSKVLNDIPEVVVVDPNFYATELVKTVNEDFNKVLGISSVFVFIILLFSFRSIVLSLIAFIPMSVSWYVVKGVMGLVGMDFNMINIVIATFIFGVGVDYSIFVMKGLLAKERGEDNRLLTQHKAAILLSAFMLIVALGSLLFATHPAISSIGFTTLIGMSSTVMLTYTIQPALFRYMTNFKFFKRIIK